MNKILANLLMAGAVALVITLALLSWANTPIVYESFSQKTCVEVDDPAGKYSCENLPPRYFHEWRE